MTYHSNTPLELEEHCQNPKAIASSPSNVAENHTKDVEVLEVIVNKSCPISNSVIDRNDDLKKHQVVHNNIVETRSNEEPPVSDSEINVIENTGQDIGNPPDQFFTCPFCKLNSKDIDMLKLHIENIHMENQNHDDTASNTIEVISRETCYNCDACNYTGNGEELRAHVDKLHEVCEICGSVCTDKNSLTDHMKTQHDFFTCEICSTFFGNFLSLKEHLENLHSLHICEACGLRFISLEALKTHTIEEHEELVVLHTMASQVNDMHGSDSPFQVEVMKLLQKLLDNQNTIRQEIFLLRTNGLNVVNVQAPENVKVSKKNISETHETSPKDNNYHSRKTYASISGKSPSNRNHDSSKSDKEKESYHSKDRKSRERESFNRNRSNIRTSSRSFRNNDSGRFRSQPRRPVSKHRDHQNRQNRHSEKSSDRGNRGELRHTKDRDYRPTYDRRRPFEHRYPSRPSHQSYYYPRHHNQSTNGYYVNTDINYPQVQNWHFEDRSFPRHSFYQNVRDSRHVPFYDNGFNIPTYNRFTILGN